MFLYHTKIQETFLNAATDHSLVSWNSDSPKQISRSGGVKKHQCCDAEKVKTPKRVGLKPPARFAGSDLTARSAKTNPLVCVVTYEVKSSAGGGPSSVEEWEWNAFSHFSTWTAPGSVTRKRNALKVANVSWFLISPKNEGGNHGKHVQTLSSMLVI